jgi:hypothetical protein
MTSPSTPNEKNPLEAAQKIVAELAGMPAERQLLALRFATETLGLKSAPAAATAQVPLNQLQQPALSQREGGVEQSANIRSFTEMKAPKSDRQFTAVVAYFYQFQAKAEERKDTIDAETMKEAARLAGWPQVARWSMTLTNAKNAGYLDMAGSGNFKLSSVGENLVAITLPGDAPLARAKNTKAMQGKKPKKRISKK